MESEFPEKGNKEQQLVSSTRKLYEGLSLGKRLKSSHKHVTKWD